MQGHVYGVMAECPTSSSQHSSSKDKVSAATSLSGMEAQTAITLHDLSSIFWSMDGGNEPS